MSTATDILQTINSWHKQNGPQFEGLTKEGRNWPGQTLCWQTLHKSQSQSHVMDQNYNTGNWQQSFNLIWRWLPLRFWKHQSPSEQTFSKLHSPAQSYHRISLLLTLWALGDFSSRFLPCFLWSPNCFWIQSDSGDEFWTSKTQEVCLIGNVHHRYPMVKNIPVLLVIY